MLIALYFILFTFYFILHTRPAQKSMLIATELCLYLLYLLSYYTYLLYLQRSMLIATELCLYCVGVLALAVAALSLVVYFRRRPHSPPY